MSCLQSTKRLQIKGHKYLDHYLYPKNINYEPEAVWDTTITSIYSSNSIVTCNHISKYDNSNLLSSILCITNIKGWLTIPRKCIYIIYIYDIEYSLISKSKNYLNLPRSFSSTTSHRGNITHGSLTSRISITSISGPLTTNKHKHK